MNAIISELPKRPLPRGPQPPEPQNPQVQPPTLFVYEREAWEYKIISKNTADEPPLTENELNALGKDGWELAGLVPTSPSVHFYFKRVRR